MIFFFTLIHDFKHVHVWRYFTCFVKCVLYHDIIFFFTLIHVFIECTCMMLLFFLQVPFWQYLHFQHFFNTGLVLSLLPMTCIWTNASELCIVMGVMIFSCCTGCLLLHTGFLLLQWMEATLCWGVQVSNGGSFSCWRAQPIGTQALVVAEQGAC